MSPCGKPIGLDQEGPHRLRLTQARNHKQKDDHMSNNYSADKLTDRILEYVNDKNHRYAIALEGDWGSGKTRYLETTIAPALKKQGKRMVRISLFGVKTAEELYGKLGAALLHLDEETRTRRKAAGRTLAYQAPNLLSKLASTIGIPMNLNIGMKTVVDLLIGEKHVIVFDDTERRSEDADEMSLFGAINDLVEDKGLKVILVTNNAEASGAQRGFDADIRDKLVWRVFPYKPSPADLVNDVFNDLESSTSAIDVAECIRRAATQADCSNVRSMLKAESFIRAMSSLPALENSDAPLSAREDALVDALQFAFLKCKGANLEPLPEFDGEFGFTSEYMTYLDEQELRERYADFPCIEAYFDPRADQEEIDLDDGFLAYIDKQYPDAPGTVELREIKSALYDFNQMNDGEVEPLAQRISSAIKTAEYCPALLRDVVVWNCLLSEAGFETLLPRDELIDCCKRVIDDDPESAHVFFEHSSFTFPPTTEEAGYVLNVLREYAEGSYSNAIAQRSAQNFDCTQPDCGEKLAQSMSQTLEKGGSHILEFCPQTIAEVFFASDGKGQMAIRSALHQIHSYSFTFIRKESSTEWLEEIKELLNAETECERMTKLRRSWLIEVIDNLLAELTEHDN